MKLETGTFTLTKAELKAVMAFASTDGTREHLNCVLFDGSAGAVIATDGHTLIRCNGMPPCPSEAAYAVPLAGLKQAYALLRKDAHLLEVTSCIASSGRTCVVMRARDGAVCLGSVEVTLDPDVLDFPPYLACIPQPGISGELDNGVAVNADYLTRVALVGKATSSWHSGVKLVGCSGELAPILFRVESRDLKADVVIMPMRM